LIEASRAARYERHSSGVHLFLFIVLLVVTTQDAEDLKRVTRDVGEAAEDVHDLAAIDPLFVFHSARVPAGLGVGKTSKGDG
jgi:hypothetical protein